MTFARHCFLLLALLGTWSAGSTLAGETPTNAPLSSFGLLYDHFELTLAPGHRSEVLGPLFFEQQRESQHTWAISPLLSYTTDPEVGLKEFDFLYPVMTYDRYGDQGRWQFCQVLSFISGTSQTETVRDRFTIFPFYFQQRSSDPSKNYTAVFPFYGHLHNRMFRQDIFFVMFPFYAQTSKKDYVTDNYVYPFFHLRHGPGINGWQFWPFVGNEHKDVTSVTNGFGDVSSVPGYNNFFALWPFFFNNHTGLGTDNPRWQQSSLLIYSFERSPIRNSTSILTPFFNHIDDREKKYREWDLPWPLIEFARGEGKTANRVWPFFSQAHTPTLEDNFYAWPVYKYEHANLPPLDHRRTRIFFFLYSDATDKNIETGVARRKSYLWPFYTRTRQYDGSTRLQVLAPLEPFVPGSHKIPRDYSPVWSVWRAERNAKTGATSQSLLWNLYRRDTTAKTSKVSALFGLYHRESGPEGSYTRLFYIPFGQRPAKAVSSKTFPKNQAAK